MGDVCKVPASIINRIPLLKAIAEEHPDQTIEIDEVSPDFFRIFVEYRQTSVKTEMKVVSQRMFKNLIKNL